MSGPQKTHGFNLASRQEMEANALRRQMEIVFGKAFHDPEHQNIMVLQPPPGSDQYLLAVNKGGNPAVYGKVDEDQFKRFIGLVSGVAGRELNFDNPRLDVTVPYTGERIHIDWPPIVARPQCFVRKPYRGMITLNDYIEQRVGTREQITQISAIIANGESLLISGPRGVGKTTLMRAMAEEPAIQNGQPAFIQDPIEFLSSAPFSLPYQADRAGGEATSIRAIVMDTLRAPITHLFIGEARGKEMLEVTEAASTDIPIYTTVHARNEVHALTRVAQMVGMNGIPMDHTQLRWVADAFRWVCHITKVCGKPRITGIVQVEGYDPEVGFLTTPLGGP
jgi:Flp pilus assembly CpaF family ATPase